MVKSLHRPRRAASKGDMPAQSLQLEVADFTDADHWRWRLQEPGGAFLADHTVGLDRADPRFAALLDLPGYVRHYSAPDRQEADERRLVGEVGVWIGEQVLGRSIADTLIARARPAVMVRVRVPPAAERLLSLPLEIARRDVREETLTQRGVCFVFETTGEEPPDAEPVGSGFVSSLCSACHRPVAHSISGANVKCCAAASETSWVRAASRWNCTSCNTA
jgi:hypothetical protein